jgi:hypothetical protein
VQAGVAHVLPQVVVEHDRDALPAQQFEVVGVEVVADEDAAAAAEAREGLQDRRVAAAG